MWQNQSILKKLKQDFYLTHVAPSGQEIKLGFHPLKINGRNESKNIYE